MQQFRGFVLYMREGEKRKGEGNCQPRLCGIISGDIHEGGVTANGGKVPNATIEITVAELPETTVMHKKMSAPEIRRDNLQTVKVRNPSIRPRGGQKHICKCS